MVAAREGASASTQQPNAVASDAERERLIARQPHGEEPEGKCV